MPLLKSNNSDRNFYSPENLEKYIDDIIILCPDYDSFKLEDVIAKSNIDEAAKRLLSTNHTGLRTLLKDKHEYIDVDLNFKLNFCLTKLGREVKHAGGHGPFCRKAAEEAAIAMERQKLNDEKLKYEVRNVKRIYKTYWFTFWISIVGFLLAVGKILHDIFQK